MVFGRLAKRYRAYRLAQNDLRVFLRFASIYMQPYEAVLVKLWGFPQYYQKNTNGIVYRISKLPVGSTIVFVVYPNDEFLEEDDLSLKTCGAAYSWQRYFLIESFQVWSCKEDLNLSDTTISLSASVVAAADWLCSIQKSDGTFPVWVDLDGSVGGPDLARELFAGYSLAHIGAVIKHKRYQECARLRLERFLSNDIENQYNKEFSDSFFLACVYAGKMALILSDEKTLLKMISLVSLYEPVTLIGKGQRASFLWELASKDSVWLEKAHRATDALYDEVSRMIQRNERAALAHVAEVLISLRAQGDLDRYEEIRAWLVWQQLFDGSFPAFSDGSGMTSRSVSKVFEVLSDDFFHNFKILSQSLHYFSALMYPQGSPCAGGFRTTDGNSQAWIDSAGHFILGASRFLQAFSKRALKE